MNAWWYAQNDTKTGPLDQDELTRRILNGDVGAGAMLWKEGMESWRPLDEIEELRSLKAAVPPPLPPSGHNELRELPWATRWPRFFARTFDLWWEILLVSFVLGAILGLFSAGFAAWINLPGAGLVFGILCIPVALLFDAVIYRLFGNTPGKALLGLHVGMRDATPLSFGQYVRRNVSVWVKGMAVGLPIVNLVAMALQARRLGRELQASYDEPAGYRVRAQACGGARRVVFGVAFLGLCIVMAAFNRMGSDTVHEAMRTMALAPYAWTNPLTGVSASIDAQWQNAAQQNDEGQTYYMFTEPTDHAVVVLAIEDAPGFTVDAYVRAFRASMAETMHFADGGRFFETAGKQAWRGSGSMAESTANRLEMQVVQVGDAFWRVVTVQTVPYAASDAAVARLHAQLWKTVF